MVHEPPIFVQTLLHLVLYQAIRQPAVGVELMGSSPQGQIPLMCQKPQGIIQEAWHVWDCLMLSVVEDHGWGYLGCSTN